MKRVYVWELPVRLTHWLIAACMAILTFTGFYIGAPFIHAADDGELIMAYMRFAHFSAAFVFIVAFMVRGYWLFAGNQYARYDQFVPVTVQRAKDVYRTGLFYAFLSRTLPHAMGHTALAGLSYTGLFVMYVIEIVTGGAMLYTAYGGGTIFWLMGGWALGIMSVAYLRLIHHIVMWGIILFVIAHLYIGCHNALIEKNGLMGSIFSGYKSREDGD
jgi:Ni/Fe-hydrogenase 1 B-type cytochrome subunit